MVILYRNINSLFENKLIKNCICGWVDVLKEIIGHYFSYRVAGPENAILLPQKIKSIESTGHG
jgi:hypothetical protein